VLVDVVDHDEGIHGATQTDARKGVKFTADS